MTCSICGKLITKDQARYTAGEFCAPPQFAHWDCYSKRKEQTKAKLEALGVKLAIARKSIEKLRNSR